MKINWFNSEVAAIERSLQADRLGHAYLLGGPPGIGKRALARALLRGMDSGDFTVMAGEHDWPERPDFYHVTQVADKKTVSVDQIRALSEEISKTSHGGGRKLAVIEPVESLTLNAANALLKTLEEPSGQSCLILIADALGRIPATVLSRCVQLKLRAPDADAGRSWLAENTVQGNLELAMWLVRGAPLAARDALADGRCDMAEQCLDDVSALLQGRRDPVSIAARWKDLDFRFAADLLYALASELIRAHRGLLRTASHFWPIEQNVVRGVDLHNLFCYQDRLISLKALPGGSFNEQLVLESLLLAWPQRFRRSPIEAPLVPALVANQG